MKLTESFSTLERLKDRIKNVEDVMFTLSQLFALGLFAFWGLLIARLLPKALRLSRAVPMKKPHRPTHPQPH
jgi:hypothetical protein